MTNYPSISQSELSRILKSRIENPEEFSRKPLIIWRTYIGDGIQKRIIEDVFNEFNSDKKPALRKWYERLTMVHGTLLSKADRESVAGQSLLNKHPDYQTGLIVVDPFFINEDYEDNPVSINRYDSILKGRLGKYIESGDNLPIVAFMACPEEASRYLENSYPDAEQYVFHPDFEVWAQWAVRTDTCPKYLIDFIRGDGHKDGIAYRWYNLFNHGAHLSQFKGCMFPKKWHKIIASCPDISNFTEEDLTSIQWEPGITDDIKDQFIKYIRQHNGFK